MTGLTRYGSQGFKSWSPQTKLQNLHISVWQCPLGDASNHQRPPQTGIPDGQGVGPPNTSTRNKTAGRRVHRGKILTRSPVCFCLQPAEHGARNSWGKGMHLQRPFLENTFRRVRISNSVGKNVKTKGFASGKPFCNSLIWCSKNDVPWSTSYVLPGGSRGRGHPCTYG